MISFRVIKIGLTTDTGLPKVNKLEARLKNDIVPNAMKDIASTIKIEASKYAPDLREEGDIVSFGIVETTKGSEEWIGQVVGRQDSIRFRKEGGQLSVKNAIINETPQIGMEGNKIILKLGNVQKVSEKCGFSWKRYKGETLNTLPFNQKFLQALEYGSVAGENEWIVVPRADNKSQKLYPEPRVGGITKMRKIAQPYGMYSKARNKLQPELPNRIRQFITPQLQEFR